MNIVYSQSLRRLRNGGALLLVGCFSLVLGCFGAKRVPAPSWNANAAANKALEAYDANGDGSIDAEELKKCASLAKADEDADGLISRDEIVQRVRNYSEGKVGELSAPIIVKYRGRPLPGAKVELIPEVFMSDMVEPATGVTNKVGLAIPSGEIRDGMTEGFYRVKVSKLSSSGKETLPAKFNEETELGLEVHSGSLDLSQGLMLDLK